MGRCEESLTRIQVLAVDARRVYDHSVTKQVSDLADRLLILADWHRDVPEDEC